MAESVQWCSLAETYFNLSISGHQQKDGLDSDPTVAKTFLQVSWNADGVLLMAQTHFQTTRQKHRMSFKHRNCFCRSQAENFSDFRAMWNHVFLNSALWTFSGDCQEEFTIYFYQRLYLLTLKRWIWNLILLIGLCHA
jgi:predicted protein tyrosine phosphatase